MSDIYEQIWNEVYGHSPAVDQLLVQSWVRDTWREIAEYRTWSWLRKKNVISVPVPYSTGTCAVSPADYTVTFTGATLTESMIGRQFRIGSTGNIYEITDVDTGASTATIFPAYADTTAAVSGVNYKIFTAYIVPPDNDFFAWIAVKDPTTRKRLRLHVNQETIDYHDAQRAVTAGTRGGPACVSGIDWTSSYAGKVYSALQVTGSGPGPVASGTYTGTTDSLLIIRITTGGARDTAEFSYQKDSGTVVTAQSVSSSGSILPEGIGLSWPTGTYVVNDVFVIRLSTRAHYGMPRYELYPHPTAALFLPCTYATRVQDIDEDGFVLPYTMRSDIIKLGSLAKMARYPGTDQNPNPYAQIARAEAFEKEFKMAVADLATQDDYIMETNVLDGSDLWEYSLLPWMTASGSGMYPTQDYDPRDLLLL